MKIGKLYLIPTTISDNTKEETLPSSVKKHLEEINFFIAENIRTSRRFIKKVIPTKNIDNIIFHSYGKNDHIDLDNELLPYLLKGLDAGIISEAGLPAIADPGSDIVEFAHKFNIKVVPLSGPSSIILALVASGLNGQNFAFNGYLPINSKERNHKIKQLENLALNSRQTQIFMETPYRNNKLIEAILKTCNSKTKLCIAANITAQNENIITKSIEEWKSLRINYDKQPTIFLLG
jgi:16S rRNA (cytidine1402-2'-O)-methyltransferase